VSAAAALAKRYPASGGKIDLISLSGAAAATQRAIRPQAAALALFAGLAGLIALAVIVQLLSRQLTLDSAEFPVLRALGMTRGALVTLSLARTAVVTGAGGLIAVGIAIAASPLMPIGAARLAEPAPGVEVNLAILAAGFAVLALVPLAVLVPAAWGAAARPQGPLGLGEAARVSHVSRLGSLLGGAGSVTGGIGVRMAFEPGRGRTAVPVRSALVGTTVAVASGLAAVVFGASLIGLVGTPHRYGQNWAQVLNLGFGGVTTRFGAKLQAAVTASGCPPGSCTVTADQRPSDIRNYTGVRDTPLLLGAVLALLAVATLIHVLLTSVRRRRPDLAVLKSLGLRPAQVLGTVLWQATALAAAALLVGLPLGVLAGRWAWVLFAGSAGVAPTADIPVMLVLAAIPVTLLLAIVIAAGPGWAAARVSPASVLRAE
jgi:FtsX-like permease family protein